MLYSNIIETTRLPRMIVTLKSHNFGKVFDDKDEKNQVSTKKRQKVGLGKVSVRF